MLQFYNANREWASEVGDFEVLVGGNSRDLKKGYHTYKTVWTEKDIQYFIDGQHVYTFTPKEYDDQHYPFRHPFYFLINMAVGGNFGGPEVDDAIFPVKFYVDYIKVTKQSGSSPGDA